MAPRKEAEQGADKPATREVTIYEKFAEPFPFDCVEWRAQTIRKDGTQALALAYIDARSVMARLDETVGPQNWQDTYREEGGRMVCNLAIRVNEEWVFKEDGAGDSNFEAEKGGISGAFKRAAVKWGIGRYLYDVDAIWADCVSYDAGQKKAFRKWAPKGEQMLAEALRRAPGPRTTGKPFSVEKMLELIREARTLNELRTVHEQNWAMIPLEYRKEVLGAKDSRKAELSAQEAQQPQQTQQDEGSQDNDRR